MKKVAFVGAGCVGKTELLKATNSEVRGARVVTEAARWYFGAHPEIPEVQRFDFGPQSAVQAVAYRRERRAHSENPELIIADRSVFDAPAYVSSTGDIEGAERLFWRMESWLPTYDGIYLLDPADVPFQNDEIRFECPDTRQRLHEAFLDFFSEHGVGYELLSGTTPERLAIVKTNLVLPIQINKSA